MNRFGSKTFGNTDNVDLEEKKLAATTLQVQAAAMVAAGRVTGEQLDACLTLADLRRLVNAAALQAAAPVAAADVEGLQARADTILATLESGDITTGKANELLNELAEIMDKLARDGERMSDFGDGRREAVTFHQSL